MDALKEFVIPVRGLAIGVHEFSFEIDWSFFRHFEHSPVEQGRFTVAVTLDKQLDHWQVDWVVNGILDTDCDRCLAPIALPVNGVYRLFVKFEDDRSTLDSDEVIYIARDMHKWQIAQYLYEFVLLSIPVSKTYACGEEKVKPCDEALLSKLDSKNTSDEANPVWDILKQIEENK